MISLNCNSETLFGSSSLWHPFPCFPPCLSILPSWSSPSACLLVGAPPGLLRDALCQGLRCRWAPGTLRCIATRRLPQRRAHGTSLRTQGGPSDLQISIRSSWDLHQISIRSPSFNSWTHSMNSLHSHHLLWGKPFIIPVNNWLARVESSCPIRWSLKVPWEFKRSSIFHI